MSRICSGHASYIHTYIHTYIYTYIHTYIHTYIQELAIQLIDSRIIILESNMIDSFVKINFETYFSKSPILFVDRINTLKENHINTL